MLRGQQTEEVARLLQRDRVHSDNLKTWKLHAYYKLIIHQTTVDDSLRNYRHSDAVTVKCCRRSWKFSVINNGWWFPYFRRLKWLWGHSRSSQSSAVWQAMYRLILVATSNHVSILHHFCDITIFSERELTFTFAICCRPSVCRLSVCNVRAPYSGGSNFRQYFYGIRYPGHPLTSTENFMEVVQGEPHRRGS